MTPIRAAARNGAPAALPLSAVSPYQARAIAWAVLLLSAARGGEHDHTRGRDRRSGSLLFSDGVDRAALVATPQLQAMIARWQLATLALRLGKRQTHWATSTPTPSMAGIIWIGKS
jgi:hypothetical protein